MSLAAPMLLLLEAFLHVSLATKKTDWSECFQVNGADYRGFQNQTSVPDGKPCLYWNQTHQHAYNTERFPNGQWGLGNHNYCRNPDGDVQPWCYVSESEEGIYWKYCDIPTCQMPGYRGCFLDSGNPPALSGSSGTSTKLTVQVCIRFCRRRGYSVRRATPVSAGTSPTWCSLSAPAPVTSPQHRACCSPRISPTITPRTVTAPGSSLPGVERLPSRCGSSSSRCGTPGMCSPSGIRAQGASCRASKEQWGRGGRAGPKSSLVTASSSHSSRMASSKARASHWRTKVGKAPGASG
uniref:Kringle-containing protein marking the eye and the nose n=1 Tax=Erpetoichthys calabaricus TaxID=27687 RepID=A0A8C4SLD9_ERPCA